MKYTNINDVGKQWIKKYTLALSKELLGAIRSKYASIPIPGSEIALNGADLKQEAQTEKDALIEQLRENLLAAARRAQLEKDKEESENLMETLKRVPLKIYIG
jgi:C4-type Zn-finger protein